jgi:glycosyltransferase involved in cell wall biosynthesis
MSILVTASMAPGSAVTAQTVALVECLSHTDDVQVWVPSGQDVVDLPVPHRVIDPDATDAIQQAREFAQVIHVVSGDGQSAPVAAFARDVPGVVLLHDTSLLLALDGVVEANGGRPEHLVKLVRAIHGPAIAAQLEMALITSGAGTEPALHQAAHVLPYFLHAATVVVTHSKWAADRITHALSVPALVAPLPAAPYEPPAGLQPGPNAPVVVPGIVNRHKLVATAIEGYARSDLAGQGHGLVVLGRCDERMGAHLRLTARREGVEDHVTFMAPRLDEDFLGVLAQSLAIVTLRQHNTEAQSAALLAGLVSGRPVVTTRGGGAGEIPDDLLVAVPAGGPGPVVAGAVAEALRAIAADPAAATEMAVGAGEWVRARHTLPAYVAVVRDALAIHERRLPEVDGALQMADRLFETGLLSNDGAVTACAAALASLGS